MKKVLSILLIMVLAVSIFTACGGEKKDEGDKDAATNVENDGGDNGTEDVDDNSGDSAAELKDGTYTDEEADFDEKSGWKDNVTVEVKDGKIASVEWNSTSKDEDKDKKTASKDGSYGMVEHGNATAEWHEQAEKVESFLVEKQDPEAITLNDDGTTDAIAGVTINVKGFVELIKGALDQAK